MAGEPCCCTCCEELSGTPQQALAVGYHSSAVQWPETRDSIRRQHDKKSKGTCYLLKCQCKSSRNLGLLQSSISTGQFKTPKWVLLLKTWVYLTERDPEMHRAQAATAQPGFPPDLQSSTCPAEWIQCSRACASKSISGPFLSHIRAGFMHGRLQIFSWEPVPASQPTPCGHQACVKTPSQKPPCPGSHMPNTRLNQGSVKS